MKNSGKLLHWSEVPAYVSNLRRKGKSIVTTNGAFDVLHLGHIRYLREASAQGDILIVGLNSDSSVRAYKGEDRPINPQEDRAEVLLSLRFVDYVVIFNDIVPMPFIELVRPNVHVNGEEYGGDCIEAETVARLGARLHLVPRQDSLSTTDLINRISGRTG